MRFFIPSRMVTALQKNAVGRGEFYCYAVLQIFGVFGLFFSDPNEFASVQTFYTYLVLIAFGIILDIAVAYRANKAGDGKRFWYRCFSLWWPVSWLTLLVSLPIVFVGSFAIAFVTDNREVSYLYTDAHNIFTGLATLLGAYFMYVYMRRVSRPEAKK